MSYESPNYELLMKKKNFEVRRYFPFQIVQYDNPEDPESNQGFRTLFQYIGSKNRENQKIPMTTPVLKRKEGDRNRMAFVVPRDIKDPPMPLNSNLEISTVPGGVYVVHPYRGSHSNIKFENHKNILKNLLEERHYRPVGPFISAFYNPPFTPPFLRHNEVLVEIDYESFEPVY